MRSVRHDADEGSAHEVERRRATRKRKSRLKLTTGNAAPPDLDATKDGSSFEDKKQRESVPLSRDYYIQRFPTQAPCLGPLDFCSNCIHLRFGGGRS